MINNHSCPSRDERFFSEGFKRSTMNYLAEALLLILLALSQYTRAAFIECKQLDSTTYQDLLRGIYGVLRDIC